MFGGGLKEGEVPEDAVRREILEELSYILNNPKLVMTKEFDKDRGEIEHKYVFIEQYDDIQELILGEGKSVGWYQIDRIINLDMIPYDKQILVELDGQY